MQSLKILTFNWHDPYIYLFGQTAQDIHVCDWMRRADGTQGWDYQKRPLRENLHLIKDASEATAGLEAGRYDLAVAHTLQDIRFLNDYDVPAIFLAHNALHNDGMNNKVAMTQIRDRVVEFVNPPNRVFAAISQMKLNSWGLDGHVILPGIDVADYGGYSGEEAIALAVGNLFLERDFMLGYSVLSEALENLPHRYVGENPSLSEGRKAENWEDLKAIFRSHRLYANATVEAFEDGYNLGMLEAMATGMPVVTMKNATSPIVEGVNGYVCETPDAMRDRVSELLENAELARSLGESARKTVEDDFSVEAFVSSWMQAFDRCLSRPQASASVNDDLRLDVSPADLYAYDEKDVQRFLAEPDRVVIAKAKIDRYGDALMIDLVLVHADTGEQAVWAGFQAQVAGDKLNVEFPPYLTALQEDMRTQIEQVLVVCGEEARKREHAHVAQLHLNLGETDSLVSRVGDDRITPGDVRADIYLHHAKRYGFASQFCDGKDVVDIASGTGYGSKILARRANRVVALDIEAAPLRYGRRTFDSDNIGRSNADMRALPFADDTADTVVCFEAIEHITEHREFLREIHRVLREDGLFVVSTPNLDIYGLPENDNPFHVGMLAESDFTDLLSEFFEDVVCVSQERASGPRSFYDYFNFTDDPNADKEMHVAVCSKPKKLSGSAGGRESGEKGGEANGVVQTAAANGKSRIVASASGSGAEESSPNWSEPAEIEAFLKNWEGPIRLNLGCGLDNRVGYINVDAYVDNADLKLDILNLPVPDDSVDEIFSSHMLEHLGKYEVPRALQEWYRVLKPAGKLQLNLPDLEWIARQWLDLPEEHRWGWALDALFGLQNHDGEYHKTGFTLKRAEKMLVDTGFSDVVATWTWSHGVRCVWVEGVCPADGRSVGHAVEWDSTILESQFTKDISEIVPYSAKDVETFLEGGDWTIGFVSFERLPMDGEARTVSVALKKRDVQMVLQGLRLVTGPDPQLYFPTYMGQTHDGHRREISEKVGSAYQMIQESPAHRNDSFVFANFGEPSDLGLEKTGERVIPGLTELSIYVPHIKRYLLARAFAGGERVLDAGCGSGYGAKLMSHVASHVTAVDLDEAAVAFCRKTFADDRIDWSVADLRTFEPEEGSYGLVTSFEVIEHLHENEIQDYLARLYKALKPDGTLLISTPNRLVSEKWNNPFHFSEMTREEFVQTLSPFFDVQTLLGQAQWSSQIEISGQSAISRRLTDDDDMFVAVCKPLTPRRPPGTDAEAQRRGGAGASRPSAQTQALVDVVIPLYNKAEYTKACLDSLETTKGDVPFRLILVDNGSTDGTGELLDAWADRAVVVRPGKNLGFSKGNNLGAEHGDSPYILFLNNDTVAEEGWLDRLFEAIDSSPEVGIVSSKLLYPDRTIQHAGLEIINGVPDHVFRNAAEDDPRAHVSRDLDMVTGACLMIRRELFETLGGFDDAYVNGVEDVDLCLRVRDRGFRVRYVAESVLEHHEGTSEGRYDHVQPNLQKFAHRFQGRFDGQGRFVPVIDRGDAPVAREGRSVLRGVWEGTQFVRHSLSIVNTSITSELLKDERVELRLIPYEAPTFGPEENPEIYRPIARALQHKLSGTPDFHVRHKWPPDFAAPPAGHWIVVQPWEFGRIPAAWIEPIQNRVDEVWVPSFYAKQCYVDSGIDADRVQVVPNGVDCDRFRPGARPLSLETDKTFRFLFVGGTIYRKGIDILLNAYRQAFTADDDVCLVVKGMGDDTFYKGQTAGDMIRKMQSDGEAPEILHLTEELSDEEIAGLYTACNCLVHPYRGEGFGMPVAEAMACDLPVIVTRGGATDDFCVEETAYFVEADRRDIVYNEKTAGQTWLFEPQVDSLIDKMNQVLKNPDEASEKGKLGGVHVRETLTWKQASDRAVERLEIVCSEPIRRTITLASAESDGTAIPSPRTIQVDCLLLASDSKDRKLAGHSLDRYTPAGLNKRVVDPGSSELPLGAMLNTILPELTTDIVLFLREEAIVTDGWLEPLLDAFDADEMVGIVVPSMPNGRGEQAVEPRYNSKKKELQKFARRRKASLAGQSVDVGSVGTACVLVRRDLLVELGGFEATFQTDAFIDDLIRRSAQKGYRTVCVRDSFVHCESEESSIKEARERRAASYLAEGDRHRLAGEHDQALARYRDALDLKDDYVEAALVCSATLLEMDRPEEAAEPFSTLVEKYPDSARIKNYLGRCLFRAGKTEEAKARFEQALALMPAFVEARGNLAVLLWEQGRFDEAVEHVSAAAELAPNDPDTLFNIGMIYAQLGQGNKAIEALSGYLTVSPEDNDTRVHLAALLIDGGRESDGLTELEHVLSEVPDHEDAARVLRQLEMLVARNENPQEI